MAEDSGKDWNMTGASADLEKSLKLGGMAQLKRDEDEERVDDDNSDRHTLEVLLDEDKTPKSAVQPVEGEREEVNSLQEGQPMPGPLVPFVVFPEEVWEHILGKLDDSKDILNVFKAFPELEGRVLKNKYWWLFDQVVPHLRPWLNNKELLFCRFVCKKWAHGVANHLENIHKVFEHERPITGQVWYPESSEQHYHHKLSSKDFRASFSCYESKKLTQFLRDVDRHPPARNPFLGRSVKVHMVDDQYHFLVAFNLEIMEMLRKHGRHVWFLELGYSGDNFRRLVLDVMSLVPNLKGLELWYNTQLPNIGDLDGFQEIQRELFPRLPQLESLKSQMFLEYRYEAIPGNVMDFFVTCYSKQIKRLYIHQSEWKREYITLFPKLRELHLAKVQTPANIVDLLTSLGAPDLHKLCLNVELHNSPEPGGYGYVSLADIVSWIKPFPKLQHFGLYMFGKVNSEHVVGLPAIDRVPFIKSISIHWIRVHVLGPEFLRCFPSLKYARISDHQGTQESFIPLWGVKRNVYRWDLWEELPALKEINVHPEQDPNLPRHYNRTRYEWLKKQRNEGGCSLSDQESTEGWESIAPVTFRSRR